MSDYWGADPVVVELIAEKERLLAELARVEAEVATLKKALREIQTILHLDPFGADPTMDTLGEIQGIVDRAALAGEPAKDTAGDGDAKPGSAEPRQS